MTEMYVKHPSYMGKQLSLHVGGGQKTIFDNEILEGGKWEKFVGLGFLRKCTDAEIADILRGRGRKKEAAAQKAAEALPPPDEVPSAPKKPPAIIPPPASRKEALEAMDADTLYVVAQEMDLPGRSKLKGDHGGLIEAIMSYEDAEEKAKAAEVASEGSTTKSPADKIKP